MQINWGVMPLKSVAVYTTEDICDTAIDLICAKKLAEAGDMVVLSLEFHLQMYLRTEQ